MLEGRPEEVNKFARKTYFSAYQKLLSENKLLPRPGRPGQPTKLAEFPFFPELVAFMPRTRSRSEVL
jgi:hypothetical protein